MHGIKAFRFALLLIAVLLYFGHRSESVVFASRGATIVSLAAAGARSLPAREAWCDDTNICNDTAACSTECVNRDVNPQQDITCGDFYDGWQDGYCEDQCGDCSCEDYEDNSNCHWDCPEPAVDDDVCQDWCGENYGNSSGDCGTCGDGRCQAAEMCGSAYQCTADCGSCGTTGTDCNEPGECGSDRCNAQHYCRVASSQCASYANCVDYTDCCSGESCQWLLNDTVYGHCVPNGPSLGAK